MTKIVTPPFFCSSPQIILSIYALTIIKCYLWQRKTQAIRYCEHYNAIDGTDYEAQYNYLKEMLGSVGERV